MGQIPKFDHFLKASLSQVGKGKNGTLAILGGLNFALDLILGLETWNLVYILRGSNGTFFNLNFKPNLSALGLVQVNVSSYKSNHWTV